MKCSFSRAGGGTGALSGGPRLSWESDGESIIVGPWARKYVDGTE